MQAENQPGADAARLERLVARQAEKRHLAAIWAARVGLAAGMTVLDIGAGTGALALEYAALGARVLAMDPDSASLAYAAAEAARRGLALETIVGRAEALAALPAAPDRVMLTDALHHMQEKDATLRAIRAAMKPGGALFIAEYDPAGPGAVGARMARRMDPAEALTLLAAAGFAASAAEAGPDEHYTIIAVP